MRAIPLVFALTLLAFAFIPAAHATTIKCVVEAGQSVCVYPNEPEYVECVSIDGKAPVCVVDPCGTTDCF